MRSKLFDKSRPAGEFEAAVRRAEAEEVRQNARRRGAAGMIAQQVLEGILPPDAMWRLREEFARIDAADRRRKAAK